MSVAQVISSSISEITTKRSTQVVDVLRYDGLTEMYHMDAGITGWIMTGYPVS
jgi:rhodanese-related sulfurtransferase